MKLFIFFSFLILCSCSGKPNWKIKLSNTINNHGDHTESGNLTRILDSVQVAEQFADRLDMNYSRITLTETSDGRKNIKLRLLHQLDGVNYEDTMILQNLSLEVLDLVRQKENWASFDSCEVDIIRCDFNTDKEVNRSEKVSTFYFLE